MSVLHLDFETYASANLKKVGVENYVRSPDFAVTVIGWAFDDEPAASVVWPDTLPMRIRDHISADGVIRAWNASFEWHVLNYGLGVVARHEQMECVMERALAFGLPGKLGDAGPALGVQIVKNQAAHDLMMKMSKPRRDGTAWHHDTGPMAAGMLTDLSIYCEQDVRAEREIDKAIPALTPFERNISMLTARSNERGVLVDMAAVDALRAAAGYEIGELVKECAALTNGAVTSPGTQSARLLEWLKAENCPLKDTQKSTIVEALATLSKFNGLHDRVRRVLEIRQLAAKSSLAKLESMKVWASSHDGRARNMFQFYGAGRTGRWAGRGPQPQNLPRPDKGLTPDNVIAVAQVEPSGLGLFYEAPLRAISGALRSCLLARPGHVLVSIDLSQIEARVTAWLAGQQDLVERFRRGEDVYTLAAASVGSGNRQLGKVMVLACQYGMGKDGVTFQTTAREQYELELTLAEASDAVIAWRANNKRIVEFWYDVQDAARAAIKAQGGVWTVRGIKMRVSDGKLYIRKPNGGVLVYHKPVADRDGNITYEGVTQGTGGWQKQKTYGGKLVENITQAVSRDIMAEAFARSTLLPVMSIHDEIVWEIPEADHDRVAAMLQSDMEIVPSWARGLPVASELKISRRFGK